MPFMFIKNNNNCNASLLIFSIAQTANNSPFDIASLEKEVLFLSVLKLKVLNFFFFCYLYYLQMPKVTIITHSLETILRIILQHHPTVPRFEVAPNQA